MNSSSYLFNLQLSLGQFPLLKIGLGVLVLILVGCQGQTFQYSRGWTNGKRNNGFSGGGGSGSNGSPLNVNGGSSFDETETMLSGNGADESNNQLGSGSMANAFNPLSGRLRSLEYAQYLNRKLDSKSNGGGSMGSSKNSKSPLWILGVESPSPNNDF